MTAKELLPTRTKLTSRSSPPAVDSLAGASCGDPNTFSSHESILMASKTQRRNTCTLDEVRVILSSPHYELLPNPIRRNWDLDKFLLFKQHYKIVRTTK